MSQFQTPANWNVTSTSTVFHISSHDSFSFVTSFDSTKVRNIITALFVVVNFALAIVGAHFMKHLARKKLAAGHGVQVKHLTPWLGLGDIAKYIWSLHGMPGGWIVILMLFSGSIGVLHQFLTNTLVTAARVPTRCVFDYGSVVNDNNWSWSPLPDDESASLVYQSQLACLKNGGVKGIYKRLFADNEVQMFRPQAKDTIGSWKCTNTQNQTMPWTVKQTPRGRKHGIPLKDFETWLKTRTQSHHTGHPHWSGEVLYSHLSGGELEAGFLTSFFVWSAEPTAGAANGLAKFNRVLVSIVNGASFGTDQVLAMDFECDIDVDEPLTPSVHVVLKNWAEKAYGYQKYLNTIQNSALWLELTLEQIATLVIFDDNAIASNQKPPSTIGCVVDGTRVSIGIVLILGLVVLAFLCLLFSTFCVFVISRRKVLRDSGILPFDLADWQLAAYRYYQGGRSGTLEELRNLVYRYDSTNNALCMESEFKDSIGRPAMVTMYSSQRFQRVSQGSVEYDSDPADAAVSKPFQFQQKPMVTTYARVPSDTSQYTLNNNSDEIRYMEERRLLRR